jgi:hypothetical protein
MSDHRIKGTHVPRLILAGGALLLFFAALYAELIGSPIDFTNPLWGFGMIAFLLIGIAMLVASWIIGLDSRIEIFITLFMLAVHVVCDGYLLIHVFIWKLPIPVALIQIIVEAYWIAGLFDVLLMFWAHNWQRTSAGYESPEKRLTARVDVLQKDLDAAKQGLADEKQAHAVLTATHQQATAMHQATLEQASTMHQAALDQADRMHQATLQDALSRLDAATKEIERMREEANRVYTATCPGCGKVHEGTSQRSADAKRDGHLPWCKGVSTPAPGANGNHREEVRG